MYSRFFVVFTPLNDIFYEKISQILKGILNPRV